MLSLRRGHLFFGVLATEITSRDSAPHHALRRSGIVFPIRAGRRGTQGGPRRNLSEGKIVVGRGGATKRFDSRSEAT